MSNATQIFKRCPACAKIWTTRESLVTDSDLIVNGFMASFDCPDNGIVLFTHLAPYCHSTLSIRVGEFRDYYSGPDYKQRQTGKAECKGYCLNDEEMRPCNAQCELSWARSVLQHLRQHHVPEHIFQGQISQSV